MTDEFAALREKAERVEETRRATLTASGLDACRAADAAFYEARLSYAEATRPDVLLSLLSRLAADERERDEAREKTRELNRRAQTAASDARAEYAREAWGEARHRRPLWRAGEILGVQIDGLSWAEAEEQIVTRLAAVEAERDEAVKTLRGAEMCDACCGTGAALSGPCGCGGTGRLVDMLAHVRQVLVRTERERDEARAQRNALEAALASWERRASRGRGPECIYCDSDAVGVTQDGRPLCTHHARGVRDFLRAPEGT